MTTELIIRPILQKDSAAMTALIRSVFEDMDIPKTGTAYEDEALDNLYQFYQKPKATYYVVESKGKLIGGAGISSLENDSGNNCELQKMYVSKVARGKGIGSKLLNHCLARAYDFGYSGCYLETMPNMEAAQALYQKNGFTYLQEPLGETGHTACTVRMLKTFE